MAVLLDPAKFRDPLVTAKGEVRASVALEGLKTLWFNTGTLCNITCGHCYIESSPTNDRLAYLSLEDVTGYLDEIAALGWETREIGFTGGEPFMNPALIPMLEATLARGFEALVLTNAMIPMRRPKVWAGLTALPRERLTLRVSLDHYTAALHDAERGAGGFEETCDGLQALAREGFRLAVAGRLGWGKTDAEVRAGYGQLFERLGVKIDVQDRAALVLFPEMDAAQDVPEITTACWGILHKSPGEVMCASSRMVVKRKGAERPAVLACTLVAYDPAFELGPRLADAAGAVALNHPHCARFCVLGGASCS